MPHPAPPGRSERSPGSETSMRDPVTLTYLLTEELWRRFYEAHYAADPALKTRYLWGALCIVIGALGLGGLYDSKIVAVLLLLTGFYAVLSRPLFLVRSMAAARKHPFFGKEITVVMTAEGIAVRSGNTGYLQAWKNFIGYRKADPGYLLYMDKKSFFFIPQTACSLEDEKRIDFLLSAHVRAS